MNRKPFVMALAALLTLLVTLPIAPVSPAAAEKDELGGTVYLAMGDSLAYGWGNTAVEKHPYVPRFYDYLKDGSHSDVDTLANYAVGGETSTSFRAQGGQLEQGLTYILDPATDVSVVTLDIGGNDLLELMQGPCADPNNPACVPAAMAAIGVFAGNYGYSLGAIANTFAADPGEEQFIVMTYYNPWSGVGPPYEGVVELLLRGADQAVDCTHFGDPAYQAYFGMNDVITCMPGAIGLGSAVTVADVYPYFVGKGMDLTYVAYNNNIHPNNAGYTQIANVFREVYR
jgi:lysophospholipase L1-like esterase